MTSSTQKMKILPLFTHLLLFQIQKSHRFRINKNGRIFIFGGVFLSQNQHFLLRMFDYWLILTWWRSTCSTLSSSLSKSICQPGLKLSQSFEGLQTCISSTDNSNLGLRNHSDSVRFFPPLYWLFSLARMGFEQWTLYVFCFLFSLCKD